jgi:hypothetical protein
MGPEQVAVSRPEGDREDLRAARRAHRDAAGEVRLPGRPREGGDSIPVHRDGRQDGPGLVEPEHDASAAGLTRQPYFPAQGDRAGEEGEALDRQVPRADPAGQLRQGERPVGMQGIAFAGSEGRSAGHAEVADQVDALELHVVGEFVLLGLVDVLPEEDPVDLRPLEEASPEDVLVGSAAQQRQEVDFLE